MLRQTPQQKPYQAGRLGLAQLGKGPALDFGSGPDLRS